MELTPSRINGGGVNTDLGAFGMVESETMRDAVEVGWHPPVRISYMLECRFNNMWIT